MAQHTVISIVTIRRHGHDSAPSFSQSSMQMSLFYCLLLYVAASHAMAINAAADVANLPNVAANAAIAAANL